MIVPFLLGLAALLSSGVVSQNTSDVLNPNTEAYIDKVLADWNSPGGFAVAVVRKDAQGEWKVETKGYGRAALDGRKMTGTTRFGIASNSKLFTVLATGLLISDDTVSPRLTWSTRIASIIPGFRLTDPDASRQLTITDAMSHRSGLPRHDISYKLSDSPSDVVQKMKSLRFSAEFRDVFQYCNMMYTVLSTLPERVLPSKTPFIEYVTRKIFEPLGMNATTYSYAAANATGEFADGLTRRGSPFANGTAVIAVPYFTSQAPNSTVLAGAGGIISNAADLAIWLKTLLLNGAHPETNQSVIPPDVIAKAASGITVWIEKAQFPELGPVVYGGGQGRSTYRGYESIEHGGNVPGHNSQIIRFPGSNLGVMVYSNDNIFGGILMEVVKYRLIDEALGLEPIDWSSRYKTLLLEAAAAAPLPILPPPNATLPSTKLEKLAGRYHNAGYGNFELCLVSPAPSPPSSASSKCKALATSVPRIFPNSITPGVPTFFTEWNSPFGSHIRLSHFGGNVFNASLLGSWPTGNSSEPFWTADLSSGLLATAEFDGGGVGFMGIWGAGEGVPEPVGKTIQERAEVWFERG